MSETRSLTERMFSTEGNVHAVTLAALWLSAHPDVYLETIVGDDEFVYIYYTEEAKDEPVVGPATVPKFSLVGREQVSYLGRGA